MASPPRTRDEHLPGRDRPDPRRLGRADAAKDSPPACREMFEGPGDDRPREMFALWGAITRSTSAGPRARTRAAPPGGDQRVASDRPGQMTGRPIGERQRPRRRGWIRLLASKKTLEPVPSEAVRGWHLLPPRRGSAHQT